MIYQDNTSTVGNTPMVKLSRLFAGSNCRVLGKVEARNPSFSVKCRTALGLINDAEKKGILIPGGKKVTVIEPTSGNTGIGLAYICAARGYPLKIVMPESMSLERRLMMTAFGAELILTPKELGMKGSIAKAAEIYESAPDLFYIPDQFNNPANREVHYETTGPEIYSQTEGTIDVLVAGVGTGGTISGAGKYLKERNPNIRIVAVEPETSALIGAALQGREITGIPHKIQGIGAGFIPKNLDLSLIDEAISVNDDEAIETTRQITKTEGIICGISSGAAIAAIRKICGRKELAGKTIVAVLPDSGERYLTTGIFG